MRTAEPCPHGTRQEWCASCRTKGAPAIYITSGGQVYHRTVQCNALRQGQRRVERHGGTPAAIESVALGSERLGGRAPCSVCKKTGLFADFVVGADGTRPRPAPASYMENGPDNISGYNALRVPWHMGTDALLYGRGSSKSLASRESRSLKARAHGDPTKVRPRNLLNGTPYSTSDCAEEAADALGPAAMASGDRAWTNRLWKNLARNPCGDGYYGETIKMIVYIVMAGDYWAP